MTRYTDAELEALLDDLESDLAERKETFNGDVPTKARQAICAFANDLPNRNQAGVLFIGVKDDGSPSNLQVTDQMLRSLADMRSDGNILPMPAMSVEKRLLKGVDIAVITVLPSDMPPIKYNGRIWIRTGPRRSTANEQEERILIEKLKTFGYIQAFGRGIAITRRELERNGNPPPDFLITPSAVVVAIKAKL